MILANINSKFILEDIMEKNLEKIFILESKEKYNEAFISYKSLLNLNPTNFKIWKYYFFFLWSMIEDVNGNFTIIKNENLNIELNKELKLGMEKFKNLAEFNFITGYTISIFPYEFGDYDELEELGQELLCRACELDSENPFYKMVFLGSIENRTKIQQNEYETLKPRVEKLILEQNSENGLLNKYYRQIFVRK